MSTATTTGAPVEDGALRWFQRLVWAGIIGNVVMASLSHRPHPSRCSRLPGRSRDAVGVAASFRDVASCFSPGSIFPPLSTLCRNRFAAVFAVVCRFARPVFWLWPAAATSFSGYSISFSARRRRSAFISPGGADAAGGTSGSGTAVAIIASLLAAGLFGWGAFTG